MKKTLFFLSSIALLSSACKEVKTESTAGITRSNMDSTVIPGDDFYRYTNGGWMDTHPLKPENARFGTFDALREQSQEQVKTLITELSTQKNENGSIAQKIGDLYSMVLDSAQLNQQGATPLVDYLKTIQPIQNKTELSKQMATMFRDGFSPFFNLFVYADDKNSSMNILHLNQGGINIGDRDYYLDQDEKSKAIRTQYLQLIKKLFVFSGYTDVQAQKAASSVLAIETELAKDSYAREKLRDPIANYHKISVAELAKAAPAIDWATFFSTMGLKNVTDLNVAQPEAIAKASQLIAQLPVPEIKDYLAWTVMNDAASYLNQDYLQTSFDFYGKTLSGKQELRAPWKRAVDVVDGVLGEAVGQMYVERHFPTTHKDRMVGLVKNLQTALGERIQALEWMSDVTKGKAMEKLATFHIKIGYPDKWRDYSGLTIDKTKPYFENIIASNRFDFDFMISKFGQPLDTNEWHMTPQTVNAYYNPATNEICFPAAILQPPFFNMEADDAVNYGAIGVVIGHEMTHGFDDQGRQYDKNGNLADWWTPEDAKNFDERAKVLSDFFDQIVVIDTVHANGKFTLGENIADHGGLQVCGTLTKIHSKERDKPIIYRDLQPIKHSF